MSNLATYLQLGDMVNLEGDSVFDPACEDRFCRHRSENSELTDIESDGELLKLTFVDSHESYTGSVPRTHRFADPD